MINCQFENGNKASLRHVVVDAIVVTDNKILLVKRAAHLTNPNKYAIIGGFLDREETIEEAVVREVKEETGYDVKLEKLLRFVDNPNRPKEDRQNVAFVYVAQPVGQSGKPDNESSEVTWFDLDKLPPAEDFAFDHYEQIEFYLKSLKAA